MYTYSSPSHSELALQCIYGGVQQDTNESVYLERVRNLGEDGFIPAVCWTLHNSLKIVSTVINDLKSKPLTQLVAGYIINLPFQFRMFQERVIQFHAHLPAQQAGVNTVQNNRSMVINTNNSETIKCYCCGDNHYIRECPVVVCMRCPGKHDSAECRVPRNKLVCTKCSLRGHTTRAHFGPVQCSN